MVKSDLNSCNYKINYKSKKPEIETSIKTHVTCENIDVLSSCYVLQFDIIVNMMMKAAMQLFKNT